MVIEMAFGPKILFISNGQTTLPSILHVIQQHLQVVLESHPTHAFQRWIDEAPDLMIIDLEPVELLALSLVNQLREQVVIPILLLSTIQTIKFMLEAYEAGVDEYILKPVEPSLLHAKVKAWLRRSWTIPVEMLESLRVGDVRFLPSDRAISFGDQQTIRLTNLELRLMYYLISHAGRTVTAEELCQRVWGVSGDEKKTTLKNVVYRLRLKIEEDPARPQYIHTVSGIGYKFKPE